MKTIEIDQVPEILSVAPNKMCVMLVGDTGVGKTTVIERYAEENGYFLKTLVLSQLDASDALSVPVKGKRVFNGKEYDTIVTAVPEWVFELAEHEKAMLFLDEFLCSQPSVMNAFLNFLTQKNVNGIDLSHVKVVAATNIDTYTFEPAQNILSRFCWFHTVNSNYNEYISDKRIINDYHDETDTEGIVFEPRSLKPRCQELLSSIPDEYLDMFYQGFTNTEYLVIHSNPEINRIMAPYFRRNPETRKFEISEEQLADAITILKKTYPRVRTWNKTYDGFLNLDMDIMLSISKLLGIEI